jgi:hypothetical protein
MVFLHRHLARLLYWYSQCLILTRKPTSLHIPKPTKNRSFPSSPFVSPHTALIANPSTTSNQIPTIPSLVRSTNSFGTMSPEIEVGIQDIVATILVGLLGVAIAIGIAYFSQTFSLSDSTIDALVSPFSAFIESFKPLNAMAAEMLGYIKEVVVLLSARSLRQDTSAKYVTALAPVRSNSIAQLTMLQSSRARRGVRLFTLRTC